jgi:hypothetical protein
VSEDQATIEVSENGSQLTLEAKEGPQAEPQTEEAQPRDYEAEIAKLRKENANWRTKYREAEPVLKQHQEMEEASKTELQREREAREALQLERDQLQIGYTRMELAAMHNIPPDDIDLIGSGSREEMEARAQRLGVLHAASTKTAPPPSDRPVEGLRPGATPEPPKPADDSYPAAWAPAHVKEQSRSQYGQ